MVPSGRLKANSAQARLHMGGQGYLPGALAKAGLAARMLLQVHDELLFEVPEAEADETSALVRSVMEGAAHISVPLVADADTGANWAEAR